MKANEINTFGEMKEYIESDIKSIRPNDISADVLSGYIRKTTQHIVEKLPFVFRMKQRTCAWECCVIEYAQIQPMSIDQPIVSGTLPIWFIINKVVNRKKKTFHFEVEFTHYDEERYPNILETNIEDFILIEAQSTVLDEMKKEVDRCNLYLELVQMAKEHGFTSLAPIADALSKETKLAAYSPRMEEYKVTLSYGMAGSISSSGAERTMKNLEASFRMPEKCSKAVAEELQKKLDDCKASLQKKQEFAETNLPAAEENEKSTYFVTPNTAFVQTIEFLKSYVGEGNPVDKNSEMGQFILSTFDRSFHHGKETSVEAIRERTGKCSWSILDKDSLEMYFDSGVSGKNVPMVKNAIVIVKF